jgi:iron complex transport system ATP-binding protein
MILKVDDLAFHYKSHKTLNHISFSIQKGEITVILGPNGVGKTTLLKCLNNILSPQKGEIFISGQNIRQMNIRQIARQVSYVAQRNEAARITAFDAVLMGRHPYSRYKTTQNDLKKVDAVMKKLNLSHMCLKFLDQMSGGELQKVAIARALVQETDLFLLDEPTSSLDLKNQTNILGLIQRIVKEHDIAAVMTMHDLNSALRYADRFLFLKDKTIYGAGQIDELSPQMVADVYDVNVEILHHKDCAVVVPVVQEERKQEKVA